MTMTILGKAELLTNSRKAASIVNHKDDDNLGKKPTGRNFDADRRLGSEKSVKNYEPFLDLRVVSLLSRGRANLVSTVPILWDVSKHTPLLRARYLIYSIVVLWQLVLVNQFPLFQRALNNSEFSGRASLN